MTMSLDQAVADGGAYEILRKRLSDQGQQLKDKAQQINQQRLNEFGKSEMSVIGRIRIRSENNCNARDIVRVGDWLLFGYNVFIGLKKETQVSDVFSLYRLIENEQGYDAEAVDFSDSFLNQRAFVQDFQELYTYYKNTRLLQLVERDGKLLASFQIGERISDIRVFRWLISADRQTITYIDNRGERDIALPPPYDFEWQRTSRDDCVNGRHPHVNILDTVFVETVGGDLTVKCENNTEDGLGIYREPVLDKNQSLLDAQIEYAKVGSLILLKILPYREEKWRYLLFNPLNQSVQRIDAIGQACIQLPEDHGIIFPGGYYLQSGEYKLFDQPMAGMRFRRIRRSPNGEDVLYIFYEPVDGRFALFNYNMIERQLATPLFGHGYALLEDGRMVLFEAVNDEPTRIHPMQIWQTPFYSDEFAAGQPSKNTVWSKIGNAELVRGISDLFHLTLQIDQQSVSIALYEQLIADTRRLLDSYFWLADQQTYQVAPLLREIIQTSEQVLDEYEKVESIRKQSQTTLTAAINQQKQLLATLYPDDWQQTQQFVDALNNINQLRGHLVSLHDLRYVDLSELAKMEQILTEQQQRISHATATFLADAQAMIPFIEQLKQLEQQSQRAVNVKQLDEILGQMALMSTDLDMLSTLIAGLQFSDTTQQTAIIEAISQVYGKINQARVRCQQQRRELNQNESVAQFSAQFNLFNQSISHALMLATDPERNDEQLARLLMQLEELESQFSEQEQFLNDIIAKREELLETFAEQKQQLLDDRQRKAQSVQVAADRILYSLAKRTERLTNLDELNSFFAADPLALKVRELSQRLRDLKESVKADDIDGRFKAAQENAIRSLRDRSELFENNGNIIKLGRHRFSVNSQALDLTLLPSEEHLYLHLNGTDFQQQLDDPELNQLKKYWQSQLESESADVYRSEYLAYGLFNSWQKGQIPRNLTPEQLTVSVQQFATPRYKEGYQKGIHDHDAALLLQQLLPLSDSAGLLRFNPRARALAVIYWINNQRNERISHWPGQAKTSLDIKTLFNNHSGLDELQHEIAQQLNQFYAQESIRFSQAQIEHAAEFLCLSLTQLPCEFIFSKYARQLLKGLKAALEQAHMWHDFNQSQQNLTNDVSQRWLLIENWLNGLCNQPDYAAFQDYVPEAVALFISQLSQGITGKVSEVDLQFSVNDLLGEHPRIENRQLQLSLDDFFSRLQHHQQTFIPGYQRYQAIRQQILQQQRKQLRLAEFKAKPLSSFVRNKLINQVYLPIIGDNLAKQIGAAGNNKRSDLMGMLLLISPPGYGKTTLMEYIADRLGLIFIKVNGPSLGHEVHSIDPAQAPNATARLELEKLNLAFEMANNVMLYIDDIQHTHPEFLQKFISLCDGTRRIEGVWQGESKTYDLRGKKFCVVMAGNPYTESGELFKIPDMLANRADIYNLGEVLGGMQEAFALSYIENCLTSNPVLAPLALRDMQDLYLLVQAAEDKPFSRNDLSYQYSDAEINEISLILKHLIKVRDIMLKVNQHYIQSAAQSDTYRTEPAFKLQGSYRNMNKLAEKISAVLNDEELQQLISDHYLGEAQLLTQGAEENLLKLAEIRQRMDQSQQQRWQEIKRNFQRQQALGGKNSDVGQQIVAQLGDLVESVRGFGQG